MTISIPPKPTRNGYTNQKHTIIDYIIQNNKMLNESKVSLDIIKSKKEFSDHNAIEVNYSFEDKTIRKIQKTRLFIIDKK